MIIDSRSSQLFKVRQNEIRTQMMDCHDENASVTEKRII